MNIKYPIKFQLIRLYRVMTLLLQKSSVTLRP